MLNSVTSTAVNTRAKKHKEVQTEIKEEDNFNENNTNLSKILKIISKRAQLIEDAVIDNNQSKAFLSKKQIILNYLKQ